MQIFLSVVQLGQKMVGFQCSFEDQNQGHEHLESCYTELPYLHSNINNIGMVREEIMEKSYREILMSTVGWIGLRDKFTGKGLPPQQYPLPAGSRTFFDWTEN